MRYNITILWVSLEPSVSENNKDRVHEVMLLFVGSEETQCSEAVVIYQVLKRSNIFTPSQGKSESSMTLTSFDFLSLYIS